MNDDKFRLDARRLIRTNIADRSNRMAAVDALIDMYVDANGAKPDGDIVGKLADYILREELVDASVNKVTRDDYPILSASQEQLRRERAVPLGYVSDVSAGNVDVLFYDTECDRLKHDVKCEVEKYRTINRHQPVTVRRMTDEDYAIFTTPHQYATFRGKEHVEWSLDVRRRDAFTCQKCGKSDYKCMHAHHIESYNTAIDLRNDVSNGITLCKKCHRDFHVIYGNGHNTRSQLDEWMGDCYYEL